MSQRRGKSKWPLVIKSKKDAMDDLDREMDRDKWIEMRRRRMKKKKKRESFVKGFDE